jgi:antitoxin component YwqK of YwqJK toxin-antitoxin module
MKILAIGLIGLFTLLGGQLLGQTGFDNYKKETDSLNILHYRKSIPTGSFDKNGIKTGPWTEYKLTIDSVDNIVPVVIQGDDFKFNIDFPTPTTLQKSEGTYKLGQYHGEWSWYDAVYETDNKLTWRQTRKTKFKNGRKDGQEIEFGIFGEVHRQAYYSNDQLNGYETMYWSKDVLFSKILWKMDVVQNATLFYQSGQIKMTNKLQAKSSWKVNEYHENGKLKAIYLENGQGIDGEYKEYDEAGTLVATKSFKNGVEVEK